jgi:hypothetical protein
LLDDWISWGEGEGGEWICLWPVVQCGSYWFCPQGLRGCQPSWCRSLCGASHESIRPQHQIIWPSSYSQALQAHDLKLWKLVSHCSAQLH